MADQPAGDKTEQPTPERLRKARQEGQVAQSQEVPSALITATLLGMMVMMGPILLELFSSMLSDGLVGGAGGPNSSRTFTEFLADSGWRSVACLAPIMVVFALVSCFSSTIVSGLTFSPKALKFDWDRVNPAKGIKNVISMQSIVRLLMAVLKMSLLGVICYIYLRSRMERILNLRWATPMQTVTGIAQLVFGLMLRVVVVLLVIGALDFIWQKFSHKKKLRMTRQEVKEERKQYEVSPEVKSRIRMIQMEMVRKRMLQDVPKADVVVTNPTHYAVALQYDQSRMDAPVVLAKGKDHMAERIKQIAREHDVTIMERPSLARALYAACEIGQMVPSNLFVAVAELLAVIFRMRRKKKMALR